MNNQRSRIFFNLIVAPTVKEYLRSPGDIRKGCLSAMVLNHMVDYWTFDNNDQSIGPPSRDAVKKTRETLAKLCCDFPFICDVADAAKHAELRQETRIPNSSNQITCDPGIFNAPFGQGRFGEAVRVFVSFPDNTRKNLEPAIQSVLKMWENLIES